MAFNEQRIGSMLQDLLEVEVARIKEETVKTATAQFEADLRRALGQVAVNLADYYSVERRGMDLVIHVKLDR